MKKLLAVGLAMVASVAVAGPKLPVINGTSNIAGAGAYTNNTGYAIVIDSILAHSTLWGAGSTTAIKLVDSSAGQTFVLSSGSVTDTLLWTEPSGLTFENGDILQFTSSISTNFSFAIHTSEK